MANKKISQLTAKGSALAATDLVEISEDAGGGNYLTKSVTGANIKSGLQATLVSATNIKTINGSSVLGSGDLVVGGVHVLTKPVSTRTYSIRIDGSAVTVNNSTGGNTIYLSPFIPAHTFTVSNLQINVTTLTVGGNARILVYSDVNGVPTTKLLESTSLDCSTTGVKTYTESLTFTAGTTYWLGVYSNITVTLSALPSSNSMALSTSPFPATSSFCMLSAAATFGSAPSTLGTATLVAASTNMYLINLTAA
jgi:hypothetical protein